MRQAMGAIAVVSNKLSRASTRQVSLCPAPSRGVLLLKNQAVPPRRNPPRKGRPKFIAPSSLSLPSPYGCD